MSDLPSPRPPNLGPPGPSPGARRALAVVVAVLLVGGLAAAVVVPRDGDGDDRVGLPATTSTTATTAPLGEDTTTTSQPPDGGPPTEAATTTTSTSSTTTTAPSTTTTARTTTTTARPACGTGRAVATFAARQPTVSGSQSSFVPEARVTNNVDRSIVVTELAYDVRFDEGVVRRVAFPATADTVLRPGATATFTADRVSGPGQPRSAELVRFTYHTEGHPEACRVSL